MMVSGRKIFVSYKYADSDVESLSLSGPTTARNYVDEIEQKLGTTDHIYKGEHDGEDLSGLSDSTIWSELRDRIYDSSLTMILISPGMRESRKSDRDQWIPWEISYSLKETSRHDSSGSPVTSRTNAMLAVVLPNARGDYSYFLESMNCCTSGCVVNYVGRLFNILRRNMFNLRNADTEICKTGNELWHGACSYIEPVSWADFISDMDKYIDRAYKRRDDLDHYYICKEVD
jgi:hypothetical protein